MSKLIPRHWPAESTKSTTTPPPINAADSFSSLQPFTLRSPPKKSLSIPYATEYTVYLPLVGLHVASFGDKFIVPYLPPPSLTHTTSLIKYQHSNPNRPQAPPKTSFVSLSCESHNGPHQSCSCPNVGARPVALNSISSSPPPALGSNSCVSPRVKCFFSS